MMRFIVVVLAASCVACAQAPDAKPVESAKAAAPLDDMGGRTYRGEADGFRILVDWSPRARFSFTTCHPQFACLLFCAVEELAEFPQHAACGNGRELAFTKTTSGYRVDILGNMKEDFRRFDKDLKPIAGSEGPSAFDLVRVSPIVMAFEDKDFGPPAERNVGNSSPETNALGVVVGETQPSRLPRADVVIAIVRAQGIDPDTVPFAVAESMRRRIDEDALSARTGIPSERAHDAVTDAVERVLWETRPKRKP